MEKQKMIYEWQGAERRLKDAEERERKLKEDAERKLKDAEERERKLLEIIKGHGTQLRM